jgi:hypothetical protein
VRQEVSRVKRYKGYLALLDVLGFASLISRESHLEELERYEECVIKATQTPEATKKVQYVLFSDSIILTTTEDDFESLKAICRSSSYLFHLLLEHEFAVRGAISLGSFSRSEDPNGTFIAGRAIIDAYNFEKVQDWIGIVLCPSILQKHKDLGVISRIDSLRGRTGLK